MIELIKYIFRTDLHKKKLFLLVLGVVLFAFLFTPRPADAFWPLLILGGVVLLKFFPDFTSEITGTVGKFFFDAGVLLFNWVFAAIAGLLQGIYIVMGEILISITNYFISIPVSPSNLLTPEFIRQAFDFSRLLVNGFFLLILAFIGLATILRLQEYQLQRTLPKLILIALLVNFSGVFVGVVVDIANLLTSYFLNAVAGTDALYSSNPWAASKPDPALLGQNIARIIFYLVGVLIYFAIMFIFGFRVLVLWVLTILAPLAFAAFILPATRKWWSQWLNSLIQWALVGLPISFFLVLAGYAISMKLPPVPSTSGIGVEIYNVFAPATALLLLFVGITISLSMAPGSVRGITTFARKAGTVAAGFLGAQAIMRLAESKRVRGAASRWSSSANPKFGYKYNEEKKQWEKREGPLGGAQRAVGGLTGFGKRVTGKPMERFLTKGEKTAEEKAKKEAMQASVPELRSLLAQAGTGAQKRGVWQAVLQRKQTRQVFDTDTMSGTKEDREFQKARLEDAALGAHDNALAEGDDDTVEKSRWALAHNEKAMKHFAELEDQRTRTFADQYRDRTGGNLRNENGTERLDEHGSTIALPEGVASEEYDRGIKSFRQKAQKSARTEDEMRYFSRGLLRDKEFMRGWHDTNIGGAQQASAFMRAFGQQGVQAFEDAKKPTDEYFESKQIGMRFDASGKPIPIYGDDSAIVRLEAGAAAQNLGVKPKEGAETTQLVGARQQIGKKLTDLLNAQVDATTQKTVHDDVIDIFKDMTDLRNKRNVMDLIHKDKELRKIFQGPSGIADEQARSEVAEALYAIPNDLARKDLAGILQGNPELSHVAPQLAEISNPAQRRSVAAMLGKVQNRGTRSEAASVLQETPELVNAADEIHALSGFEQQIKDLENDIKRNQAVRTLKAGRGENTTAEDAIIKERKAAQRDAEIKLNTLNLQHDRAYKLLKAAPNAKILIPQAERLESILKRPGYKGEAYPGGPGGGPATGAGPVGGGTPRGGGVPRRPRPGAGPAARAPRTTEETERRSPGRTQTENMRQRQAEQLRTDPGFRQRFLEQLARHQSLGHTPQIEEAQGLLEEAFGPNYEDIITRTDLKEGRGPEVPPPNSPSAPRR